MSPKQCVVGLGVGPGVGTALTDGDAVGSGVTLGTGVIVGADVVRSPPPHAQHISFEEKSSSS